MKVMKAVTLSLSLALASMVCAPAHAVQEVAGVKFEDWYNFNGQQLQLSGAGLRKMMIMKVYVVGLYVPRKETSVQALLNAPGPKSIQVVLLRDVDAHRLTDALVMGVEDNASSSEWAAIKTRVGEMSKAMRSSGDVREGTVVKLEYIPNQGTTVSQNGKPVIRDIPGEDFFRGVMRIWLGERPADRTLKASLVGASAD